MLGMPYLQEGPNTSLAWLLYLLVSVMALVIVVGALTAAGESHTEKPASQVKQESEVKEIPARRKSRDKVKPAGGRRRSK